MERVFGSWAQLLESLSIPQVVTFADRFLCGIPETGMDSDSFKRYTEHQIKLHLPAFSLSCITVSPENVTVALESTLAARLGRFVSIRPTLETDCYKSDDWHYGDVGAELGESLQRERHYMHCAREDTLLHYGVYRKNREYPSLYFSFSACDRAYLWNAFNSFLSLNKIPHPVNCSVIVLTRALATEPLPRNLISSAISKACKILFKDYNFTHCVTALNPLLGFDGASLRASGYIPFALSPMTYQYGCDSLFTNRRSVQAIAHYQKWPTPPIVWMIRSSSRPSFPSGQVGRSCKLVEISSEDYSNS